MAAACAHTLPSPLVATPPTFLPHRSAVQAAVDFEFKLFSTTRALADHWSTIWFCHGIVGLWRRERFERAMADHPFLPFGEDNWLGMLNLLHNCRMGMEDQVMQNGP